MAKKISRIKRTLRVFDAGCAPIWRFQSFYMITDDPRIEPQCFKKLMSDLMNLALILLVAGVFTSFTMAFRAYSAGMKP